MLLLMGNPQAVTCHRARVWVVGVASLVLAVAGCWSENSLAHMLFLWLCVCVRTKVVKEMWRGIDHSTDKCDPDLVATLAHNRVTHQQTWLLLEDCSSKTAGNLVAYHLHCL